MMTNSRRLIAAGLLGAVGLAFAGCGDDDDSGAIIDTTEETTGSSEATTPAPAEATVLSTNLSGEEEVPGPGVADGVGTATITLKEGQLCYELSATMGETPTAAHVHQGAKGAAGKVVVDLKPSFTNGESAFLGEDCVAADAVTLSSLEGDPGGFYVNIHTAEHKDGALRGQLGASSAGSGSGSGSGSGAGSGGY